MQQHGAKLQSNLCTNIKSRFRFYNKHFYALVYTGSSLKMVQKLPR